MRNSLLVVLMRQWFVVAAAVIVFIAAGGAYLYLTTPLYTSTARLHVRRGGGGGAGGGQNGSRRASEGAALRPIAAAADDDPQFLPAQAELLTSTPVLAIAASDPSVADLPRLRRAADPVEWLRRSLNVEVVKGDALFAVSFDAADPHEAERVLTAVIGAYRRYVAAQRHSPAAGLLEMLGNEKRQREAELARKQQQLLEHARSHGTSAPGADFADRSSPIALRLAGLSETLAAAQRASVDAAAARQEVAQAVLANPKYAAELAELRRTRADDDPARVRAEQEKLRTQLRALRQRHLPGHPALDAAQRDLDRLDVAYAAAVDGRLERAKQAEADAQRAFDEVQKEAQQGRRAQAAERAWLEAEVSVARRHVDALDNRIREAMVLEEATAPRVDVLASPRAAPEPTKPHRGRTAGLALIVGLLTGAALAGARDAYAYRPRPGRDGAGSALGLPILATIPALPQLAGPASTAPARKGGIGDSSGNSNGNGNGNSNGNGRAGGERDPFAEVATAFLALGQPGRSDDQATADLTAEEFAARRDRTILVTSAVSREGKSTVASRLAVSLARSGRRVLLVDANLRRPKQQALFGLGRGPGLADVLAARATLDAAIRPTSVENLELLAAGRTAADPLVLLNRAELPDVLERVAEAYDHVIIDSPSVRSGADARVIAASCDATLLVLSRAEANLRTCVQIRDALSVVGANVIGVVLNDAPQPAARSEGDAEGPTGRRLRPASPLDPTPSP